MASPFKGRCRSASEAERFILRAGRVSGPYEIADTEINAPPVGRPLAAAMISGESMNRPYGMGENRIPAVGADIIRPNLR